MSEQPDYFIVGPRFPLTGAQADAFKAGALAGLQKGAARERAAIVAWLRSPETRARSFGFDYAAAIERGEHLRADDE